MITTVPPRPRTPTADRRGHRPLPGDAARLVVDRPADREARPDTTARRGRRGRHVLGVAGPRCRRRSRYRAARDDRRPHASPRRGRPAHDGRAPGQRARRGTVRRPGRTLGRDADRTAPPRAGHRARPPIRPAPGGAGPGDRVARTRPRPGRARQHRRDPDLLRRAVRARGSAWCSSRPASWPSSARCSPSSPPSPGSCCGRSCRRPSCSTRRSPCWSPTPPGC